jgi:hypothetical protein
VTITSFVPAHQGRPGQLLLLEPNAYAATIFRDELNTSAFESNSDQL